MFDVVELVPYLKRPFFRRPANLILRILGINIAPGVRFGSGLQLPHGAVGLVVHESTVVGNNVKLYQGVTLGRSDTYLNSVGGDGGIVLGDEVIVGANASVLFRSNARLVVGNGAVIGANSVVLDSVPEREIWAGVPAKCVGLRK